MHKSTTFNTRFEVLSIASLLAPLADLLIEAHARKGMHVRGLHNLLQYGFL